MRGRHRDEVHGSTLRLDECSKSVLRIRQRAAVGDRPCPPIEDAEGGTAPTALRGVERRRQYKRGSIDEVPVYVIRLGDCAGRRRLPSIWQRIPTREDHRAIRPRSMPGYSSRSRRLAAARSVTRSGGGVSRWRSVDDRTHLGSMTPSVCDTFETWSGHCGWPPYS